MNSILCDNCGHNLCKGIAHDCHYYIVEYSIDDLSDGEIGNTIDYYCPECGQSISSEIYGKVINEWEKPVKEVKK